MRKLGWRDAAQTLAWKFEIIEGQELLGETYAMWLSPAYIPPSEMVCLLDLLPRLKWVYSQMTGTEHLDLGLFSERDVIVSNNGQLNSRRVAEMALADILGHAKRLPKHFALQSVRKWRLVPCDDLNSQTVGIIGTGNIGGALAKLCRAIGMYVIGASRDPKKFSEDPSPYHEVVRLNGELEKLLSQSDHVVITLPLNQETYGLIGRNLLRHIKRSSSLINMARGEIVHEDDLCEALSNGLLGAAYIDRPTNLPPPPSSRLYRTPNLVLTHYSSVNSARAFEEAFGQFIKGLKKVIETGEPPDRVI